jgi:hypothetical protein
MEITALSGSDFGGIQHGHGFSLKNDPFRAKIFSLLDPGKSRKSPVEIDGATGLS